MSNNITDKKFLMPYFKKVLNILDFYLNEYATMQYGYIVLETIGCHDSVLFRKAKPGCYVKSKDYMLKVRSLSDVPYVFLSKLGDIDLFFVNIQTPSNIYCRPRKNPFARKSIEMILVELDMMEGF